MTHEAWGWAIAVGLSAGAAIVGETRHRRRLHRVAKPLATILIAAAAWRLVPAGDTRWLLTAALGLSLAGDVALMFSSRWLPLGMGAFMAALVVYTVTYSLGVAFEMRHLVFAILPLALGVYVLQDLWAHVGKLRIPVLLYMLAMGALVWRMLVRFDVPAVELGSWLWGAVGAGAFMLSDTLVARRRFAKRAGAPYALELGSYYVAQWCLVAAAWG